MSRKLIDRKDVVGMVAVAAVYLVLLCVGYVVLLHETLTALVFFAFIIASILPMGIGLMLRLLNEKRKVGCCEI